MYKKKYPECQSVNSMRVLSEYHVITFSFKPFYFTNLFIRIYCYMLSIYNQIQILRRKIRIILTFEHNTKCTFFDLSVEQNINFPFRLTSFGI